MDGTNAGDIIAEVDAAAGVVAPILESGVIGGPAVAASATLVQQIIDFLHHLFPGHGAPGVPSSQLPPKA